MVGELAAVDVEVSNPSAVALKVSCEGAGGERTHVSLWAVRSRDWGSMQEEGGGGRPGVSVSIPNPYYPPLHEHYAACVLCQRDHGRTSYPSPILYYLY